MTPQTEPLISVVTVCFNAEKTIERTLQSVLHQSFQNWEMLILDGKSTDGTMGVVAKFQQDPRFKIFSEKDHGIYDAMNKGVQRAKGSFIHFLNADDVLLDSSVYERVSVGLQESNTLYHAKLKYCHVDGHVRYLGHPLQKNDLRFGLKGIHQPATFFPRLSFQRHGLFQHKYRVSADYDLIRRFCGKEKTAFLNEVVVEMADGGASAKQIDLACKENRAIAVAFGESWWRVVLQESITRFGLFLRARCPAFFHFLLQLKQGKITLIFFA